MVDVDQVEAVGAAIFVVDPSRYEETLHAWRALGHVDMTDAEIGLAANLARANEQVHRVAFELFADLRSGRRVTTADGRRRMELSIDASVPRDAVPDALRTQLHGDVNAPCWRRLAARLGEAGVPTSASELRGLPLRVEAL